MLARAYRLNRRSDFVRLRRHGRRFSHPLAVLIICPQESVTGDGDSQFAFSASKRVGNAVVRNRVKRLLRTAVRQHWGHIPSGWLCQLAARPSLAQATYAETEQAVQQLLRRAKLWRVPSDTPPVTGDVPQ